MFDLEQSIKTIGLWGVFAVVFAETGLLIGFFLPGDSLLFTAGFLASQGVFDIQWLSHGCFIAALSRSPARLPHALPALRDGACDSSLQGVLKAPRGSDSPPRRAATEERHSRHGSLRRPFACSRA